jgi:hypothetical protein
MGINLKDLGDGPNAPLCGQAGQHAHNQCHRRRLAVNHQAVMLCTITAAAETQ